MPQVPAPSTAQMELVSTLRAHGYYTSVVGKNHYGINADGSFQLHSYMEARLHEGLLMYDSRSPTFARLDDYGEWFNRFCPGCDPLATAANDGTNGTTAWRNVRGATVYNSNEPFAFPYAEELHPTRWTADMALQAFERWLVRRRGEGDERPLFLKVSFHRPHSPYDPPERWLRYMLDRADEIADPAVGNWDSQFALSTECTAAQRRYCGSRCGFQSYCGRLSAKDLRMVRAAYYASLSFVDEQAGRLLARMRREAEWRSTLVIYLSGMQASPQFSSVPYSR